MSDERLVAYCPECEWDYVYNSEAEFKSPNPPTSALKGNCKKTCSRDAISLWDRLPEGQRLYDITQYDGDLVYLDGRHNLNPRGNAPKLRK